ncbi:MAG: glycosyltransferase family 2 protein [Pedobacter sp.]|nr:MAG: glycosyltransferase family 2 protein [Pedobacter sp.]
MEFDIGISVIICTYNGADRIEMTLKHLAEQTFIKPIRWEIIIVDNGSGDDVKDVAKQFWQEHGAIGVQLQITNEEKTGLSFAREAGINVSKYKYIIFCDDDNWLDKNYVSIAYDIISSNNDIGALGGQSTATSTTSLPHWFEKSQANYAVGMQGLQSGDITSRKFLWGSSIVIRKDLYTVAYKKFPSLLIGRNGKNLSSGEDSEMCIRFIMMGFKLYYSDELKFQHFIPENRLTVEYNQRLMIGFYEAFEILKLYNLFVDLISKSSSQRAYLLFKSVLKLVLFKTLMEIEKLACFLALSFNPQNLNKKLITISLLYKELGKDKIRTSDDC